MMRKLLSLLLVVTIVLAVLPAAYAASDEPGRTPDETAASALPGAPEEPQEESKEPEETLPDLTDTYEDLQQEAESILEGFFDGAQTLAGENVKSGFVRRTTSSAGVAFIKSHEGFVQYPMWDVGQWSIGYGSRCPNSPKVKNYTEESFASQEEYESFLGYVKNGITQQEATSLLQDFLINSFEPAVNNVAKQYNVALSQNQFDALVEFSYNLGAGWTSGSRLRSGLIYGYHNKSWTMVNSLQNKGWYFINAMGTWCNVSGQPHHAIATRRIQDLEMFVGGKYYDNWAALRKAEVHYTYLFFDANGGSCVNMEGTGDWALGNRFYFTGTPYGALMNAQRSGYYFAGWYTAKDGGTKITADTIAKANTSSSSYAGITDYAHWSTTPVDPEIGSASGSKTGYTDVAETDWYADAVVEASRRNIFSGYPDGTFRPNETLTRAMAVSLLYRISGQSGDYTASARVFTDVAATEWYASAVGWARKNGIVSGTSDTTFSPNATITREQLAKMLYGYTVYATGNPSYQAPVGYTDFDKISGYAIQAMCWAVSHGIISGDSATTLSPQKYASRAQAASIFVRYLNKIA